MKSRASLPRDRLAGGRFHFCKPMVVGTCTALAMDRTPTEVALAVELGDTSEGVEGGAGPQREALAGRRGSYWTFVNRLGLMGARSIGSQPGVWWACWAA
jgi:hypothetical protein